MENHIAICYTDAGYLSHFLMKEELSWHLTVF